MTTNEKKMLKEIGACIRGARRSQGKTLRDLATESGVSKGNLSKIERGGNLTLVSVFRIFGALGIRFL